MSFPAPARFPLFKIAKPEDILLAPTAVVRRDADAKLARQTCCRYPDLRWQCAPTFRPGAAVLGNSPAPLDQGGRCPGPCGLLTDVVEPICLASMRWHMQFWFCR